MARHLYVFDEEVDAEDTRELLGGKGAGLHDMRRLGIPVPPGFTLTTETCRFTRAREGRYPEGLVAAVRTALTHVERETGRRFGDAAHPLLVSVRSGAPASMPGMLDTVLDVGLNDDTVHGLAHDTGDRRFAMDAYRRLLQMYGHVVLGIEHAQFEHVFAEVKANHGGREMADAEVPVAGLEELVARYQQRIRERAGVPFPQDAEAQLWGAIEAVFRSWDNPRAARYRRMHGIPDDLGTACTVQAMVFGNLGADSGSGVVFTRNPSTGERALYGEFLFNAQGEDVVAGVRTPFPVSATDATPGKEDQSLERRAPHVFAEVQRHAHRLEAHFGDIQDIEFTVERGTPWILQTRSAKRTAHAAVRAAVDMVDEGLLRPNQALMRVDPTALDQLLQPRLPGAEELAMEGVRAIASGLPAGPGAASGRVVLDAEEAERLAAEGQDVLLVRRETSPEDIHGMKAARGILTAAGGMTSHAAVVARGLGKCCVVGASGLRVDHDAGRVTARPADGGAPVEIAPGDVLTLDGHHGTVYPGEIEPEEVTTLEHLDRLLAWADEARRMRVRANVDTARAARSARRFGAEGIGLCRIEKILMAQARLPVMRAVALAGSREARRPWLHELEAGLEEDAYRLFAEAEGGPIAVRLLDWPLGEFLPRNPEELDSDAERLGADGGEVRRRARNLHELNPLLGHRGVRLGLSHPDLYETLTRALVRAAARCVGDGLHVELELVIPMVSLAREMAEMRAALDGVVRSALDDAGTHVRCRIGALVELPRACLVADSIAPNAEFLLFGTNDLTQSTFGISRADAGPFLAAYLDDPRGLLPADPFDRLDVEGVGELIRQGVERAQRMRAASVLGLCGDHAGDPASVAWCENQGVDYISCAPSRLPAARLSAAQATLTQDGGDSG